MRKRSLFLFGCAVLFCVIAVISLAMGTVQLTPRQILATLLGASSGFESIIIWEIRIPRILAALFAGVGLASAGMVMQSMLRNPLASSFTLGISHSAAFGAAFAIVVLGAGSIAAQGAVAAFLNSPYVIPVCAFACSLVAIGTIILLAKYKGASPETMILSGVALGSLFMAGLAALKYFAADMELAAIVFWMFGDLGRVSWENLWIIAAVLIPSILFFFYSIWNYKALGAGDETAKSLGVNVEKVRIASLLVASLVTVAVVSFTGVIGFVGLVTPHLVRRLIGGDERFLLPASCMLGALLLLASDTVARTIISPIVLPVGILTSFLGGPLFIYLVVKGRRYW